MQKCLCWCRMVKYPVIQHGVAPRLLKLLELIIVLCTGFTVFILVLLIFRLLNALLGFS